MNKKKLIMSIVAGVVALLVIAVIIVLVNVAPMLKMKPAATGTVDDANITVIKNANNDVYLMLSDVGYIMIDAGSDRDALLKSLEELNIKEYAISYILLTHTDYDHVAALSAFENAEILIGENEEQMLDGTVKRNAQGSNKLDGIELENLIIIDADDSLEIGGHTIKCISAPGHTKGSMVYLIDDKYLFTGDAFAVSGNKMKVHPYTMDEKTAKETIEELKTVVEGSELVLTSHYGYFASKNIKTK